MSQLIIHGRKKLSGEIEVGGAKNEATKLVAAAILTDEDVVIKNAPRILDLEKMMDIIKSMGGRAEWTGDHEITLNCKNLNPETIDQKAVKKLRASVVLMGPMLARFKKIDFPTPGGCIIGNRPMDIHFAAFEKMGAKVEEDGEKNIYKLSTDGLHGAKILTEFSVTATENVILAAVLTPGKTIIKTAALEPHTEDLARCLNKMGAKISGIGTHTLEIEGVEKLNGVEHSVIPDMIEVGTFAILAAATRSDITITNINPDHLDLFLEKLHNFGVNFEVGENSLHIKKGGNLKALEKIETNVYPGVPTDLQQPLAVLATQAAGSTLIFERIFEGRFNYVSELQRMGANIQTLDSHRILVTGPTPLIGTEVKSFDLRAGATLLIAGLLADGETIIDEAELIDRGYEDIVGRLQKLGAEIERID